MLNHYSNHGKILLVDKQGRWLNFSQAVLKTAGYTVSVTNSITDAWHLVSQNGTVFDLILVDLKRVEMESDVFRQLAGPRGKRRPVVVLSPTTLTNSRMSYFFKLGAYDCLEKKYDEKGLLSLVKNLLAETTIPKSNRKNHSQGDVKKEFPVSPQEIRGKSGKLSLNGSQCCPVPA